MLGESLGSCVIFLVVLVLAGSWQSRSRPIAGRSLLRTALFFPIVLSVAYLILMTFGSASFIELIPIFLAWGPPTPPE